MASPSILLTFNAGSSSVKIGIFEIEDATARMIGKAVIDLRAKPLVFEVSQGPEPFEAEMESTVTADLHEVIDEAFKILAGHFEMDAMVAAGHRVVHGGDRFLEAVKLDDSVIDAIEALTPLAPLHQPEALRFIRAVRHLRPDLAQSASFDTAFHGTQDELVRRLAIPRALHDEGIKRYGFHGLSYKFVAAELSRRAEKSVGKTVIAHLGSGASLCALEDGVSRDCSMGFSTLDGIPMATRPGWLDAGVLLHLIGQKKMAYAEVEDLLYHRSGLLGVSGTSADTRALLADDRPEAAEAIDLFALRIAGEIGRMASTLGGVDTLVFTAGIGEHQAAIREKIVTRLAWLGAQIDASANAENVFVISKAESRIAIHVVATNEEQVIADEALSIIGRI
ncbi:acetate/propionate family kinase [Rhizobium sp. B21/90]|uniref:acetate/propionate family kinase n=1 Tax=Rhizobium sp. B21/90 TaxID=2819993 RepID=UPI001C5AEC54|nr:acetate/propionate family kinase [Rhizobium sp. B21/90]QYA03515.1 acetate/propionate family kinase [Rhizobium sp. B21/90]